VKVRQTSRSNDFQAVLDPHVVLFQTQSQAPVRTEPFVQRAARRAAGCQAQVRTHVIRAVVVVEVTGLLSDVVADLDRAIELALADGPRGVACDLSAVLEGAEPAAVELLATVGRHGRDWPGIPVAIACPDPRVRQALAVHPLGAHLIIASSIRSAVSSVLASPIPAAVWLRLAPHPTAPRASRDFVTRTLLDWGLGRAIPAAGLVVNKLVTNSTVHAGTDIDLSVAWNLGALRLAVRDNSPDLPRQRHPHLDLRGRGVSVVAALSRAFGVLPTADGGKVVWAVLNAAQSRPASSTRRSRSQTTPRESPMFTDACGLADLSFCASSRPRSA